MALLLLTLRPDGTWASDPGFEPVTRAAATAAAAPGAIEVEVQQLAPQTTAQSTAPPQALPAARPAAAPVRTDGRYVVAKGDSLYGIAARHLGSGKRWPEIARLNGLSDRDVSRLAIGRELKLPSR